ncbi:MAG: DUF2079 domain-containing protein [bacterium]
MKKKNKRPKDKKGFWIIILGNALLVLGFFLYKNIPFSIWKVFFLIFLISTFVFLNAQWLNLNKDIPKIATWLILLFLTSLYIAVYSYLSIIQYNGFFTGHFDLAYFDQIIWNAFYGRFFDPSLLGYNLLGEHFSPMLFIFVPFYALWQDPRMLLILQSLFLGLGAIPIFLIARDKLQHNLLSLSLSFVYLLHPFLTRVVLFEFYEICLAPFFISLCFYFLQRRNWIAYFVFLFFSLMIKEEISLIVMTFGIYSFFKKSTKIGVTTFLLGIFWACLSVGILIPKIRAATSHGLESYKHFGRYGALGLTPKEAIKNLVFKPHKTLIKALSPYIDKKLTNLFALIFSSSVFSIMGIEIFFLVLPVVLLHFLSSWDPQYLLTWQYPASIIPFTVISSTYGLSFLLKKLKNQHLHFAFFPYFLSIAILSNYFFGLRALNQKTGTVHHAFSYDSTNHKTFLSFPKENLIYYYKTKEERKIFGVLKKIIPKERSLSVKDNLLAHFSHQKAPLYSFPNIEKADYIIINSYGIDKWVVSWENPEEYNRVLGNIWKHREFKPFFALSITEGGIGIFGKEIYREEIIKRAEGLVKSNPSQETYCVLGSIYFYSNRLKEAKESIMNALKLDPNNLYAKQMLEECKKFLDKNEK